MSISYLLSPNDYNVYCKQLDCNEVIQSGDSGVITYNDLCLYTGTGPYVLQKSGLSLQFRVIGNIMTMVLLEGGGFFTLIGGPYFSLKLGPYDIDTNTPLDWNIGYRFVTGDDDLTVPVCFNCGVSNARNVNGQLSMNSNVGDVDGKFSMTLYPLSTDNGVSQGTFPSGSTFALYVFSFSVPVSPV
jgi:hypothetical protein